MPSTPDMPIAQFSHERPRAISHHKHGITRLNLDRRGRGIGPVNFLLPRTRTSRASESSRKKHPFIRIIHKVQPWLVQSHSMPHCLCVIVVDAHFVSLGQGWGLAQLPTRCSKVGMLDLCVSLLVLGLMLESTKKSISHLSSMDTRP